VAVAAAAPQYPVPAPAYAPAPVYGAEPVYPDTVPSYNYNYGVADGYSGANFGASEARDGYNTNGEYHVALPDGRTLLLFLLLPSPLAQPVLSSQLPPSSGPPSGQSFSAKLKSNQCTHDLL